MKKSNFRWIFRITLISLIAAAVFALASSEVMGKTGYAVSFAVLAAFIMIGITFDAVGIAVAAAASNEAPFHSMAANRERGAAEALRLLRNANRVSCYCADVIGDVTGIVSGTASALIAARLIDSFSLDTLWIPIIITAAVTALTVGGKAAGKVIAFKKSTQIVHNAGKILCFLRIKPYFKQNANEK